MFRVRASEEPICNMRICEGWTSVLIRPLMPQAVDLRFSTLTGARLENAILPGAKLFGACLRNCKMRGVKLEDADLREANLNCADLQGATLNGALLRMAKLKHTKLCKASLVRVQLHNAVLHNAELRCAILTEAWMEGACLFKAQLQKADLRHIMLWNAKLQQANLDQTHFSRAESTLLPDELIGELSYRLRYLVQRVEEIDDWLEETNIPLLGSPPSASLGTDARNADFTGASLRKARLSGVSLYGATLVRADLTEARLEGSLLAETRLDEANLSGSKSHWGLRGKHRFESGTRNAIQLLSIIFVGVMERNGRRASACLPIRPSYTINSRSYFILNKRDYPG